ncbi:hypothetical protein Acr_23g0008850 [Actinidia rufa]|uniref:Uncharacterized protein n=1 Tax=Actinidia rufa TaxID=165716 RepID=A0A7J0GNX1_9ERIC|nr:hypothetical protein Acr_23g0008850 [Actinidia rufa]
MVVVGAIGCRRGALLSWMGGFFQANQFSCGWGGRDWCEKVPSGLGTRAAFLGCSQCYMTFQELVAGRTAFYGGGEVMADSMSPLSTLPWSVGVLSKVAFYV